MLQYYYIVIMLFLMGRKPKNQEARVTNRIEELRGKAGLTRQALADALDVHYQTIGYIERGEYSPSLVLALEMAEVLGVTVDQLFKLEGDKK
jgi:putative transcriptional regulator